MSTLALDRTGKAIQVLRPSTTTTVTTTTSAATSAALTAGARVARIVATQDVYYEINGTATTSKVYLPKDTIELVHIYRGDTISFIRATADGTAHITELL